MYVRVDVVGFYFYLILFGFGRSELVKSVAVGCLICVSLSFFNHVERCLCFSYTEPCFFWAFLYGIQLFCLFVCWYIQLILVGGLAVW